MTGVAQHSASWPATADVRERGHIALIVLAPIAAGLVLGLLFVLAVFGGGYREAQITGSALLALGAGFVMLALASRRFTA